MRLIMTYLVEIFYNYIDRRGIKDQVMNSVRMLLCNPSCKAKS